MRESLGQIWRLVALCAWAPSGRLGIVYFGAIFALGLIEVHLTVRMIRWTADFYNALQKLNVDEALRQIGIFFTIVAAYVAVDLAQAYGRKLLQMRWRRTLTEAVLGTWLEGRAFWHLRDRTEKGLDNPDQRIADDCRIFVYHFTTEALELVTKIVALVSYVALLWSLSDFALNLTLFGADIAIGHYLVWLAPIYVALASGITHWLGAPLVPLNVEQQKCEADFRFALARLRQTGEAVALARGEAAERRLFDLRFDAVVDNWRRLIGREFVLGLFGRPYFRTVLRIPLFLALPVYLAGKVTFGGLMQLSVAFQNVVTTLSWFIFSYRDLAELASAARRLDHFIAAGRAAAAAPGAIGLGASADGALRLEDLDLATPDGRAILSLREVVLQPGETVWLRAPSGHGKTTLIRAIAGLWRHGAGHIALPAGRISFLPQQPYWPLTGIAAAAVYPRAAAEVPAAMVADWLEAAGLGRLVGVADGEAAGVLAGLSGGERQRFALIRLLAERPDWAFLDEPTSALDAEAEADVMAWLRRELPQTTFVVVAHREPVGLEPVRVVDLAEGASEPVAPASDGLCLLASGA
jgi:vitamin B12/bleomycin/antimicrobial peptide transport system ATP-binding/permease protein